MKARPWLIWVTFFIGLALDILPLPTGIEWIRPSWTLLVLIYWVMALPLYLNVGTAFVVGLLLDLLEGSILGEHAIAMVVVAYIIAKAHRRLRVYPMQQQMIAILCLVFLYKLIIFAIQGLVGQLPHSSLYWMSILISTILWPWVFVLLRDWRKRFNLG